MDAKDEENVIEGICQRSHTKSTWKRDSFFGGYFAGNGRNDSPRQNFCVLDSSVKKLSGTGLNTICQTVPRFHFPNSRS